MADEMLKICEIQTERRKQQKVKMEIVGKGINGEVRGSPVEKRNGMEDLKKRNCETERERKNKKRQEK